MLPLWKAVGRILKKLKGLPYDLATLFLGIYTEKIIIQRDRCISMFVATLLTIAKAWTQPKCLNDKWIKMWCIDTIEYYLAIEKNETMPFAATWMDLEK